MLGYTPLGRHPRSADTPPGRHLATAANGTHPTGMSTAANGMHPTGMHSCYCLQTKLREGNVFTGVCDSVHGGGAPGRVTGPGVVPGLGGSAPVGCLHLGVPGPGGSAPGGCLVETPRTATATGGTHPTGMHSC